MFYLRVGIGFGNPQFVLIARGASQKMAVTVLSRVERMQGVAPIHEP